MTNFSKKQNQPQQLEMLAAQRRLYSVAKTITGTQMVLSGLFAALFSIVIVINPEYRTYSALWGLTLIAFDLTLLNPWQKRLREAAAKVQELFDCIVLDIDWNEIKVGKRPDAELIHEHASNYGIRDEAVGPLMNWYPQVVGELSPALRTAICQRINVHWDSKQRRRYAGAVFTVVLAITAILVWAAFSRNVGFFDAVAIVAIPMSPLYVLACRQIAENREAADRLDKLKDHTEKLLDRLNSGVEPPDTRIRSRFIQDEIFEGRKRNPLIFDCFFKILRSQNEQEMNAGAEALVLAAKSATNKCENQLPQN